MEHRRESLGFEIVVRLEATRIALTNRTIVLNYSMDGKTRLGEQMQGKPLGVFSIAKVFAKDSVISAYYNSEFSEDEVIRILTEKGFETTYLSAGSNLIFLSREELFKKEDELKHQFEPVLKALIRAILQGEVFKKNF